jgi:hypothetical protein
LVIANWWKGRVSALDVPDGVPVVRWWVGSDVEYVQTGSVKPHSLDARHNWVVAPWLARRLQQKGVGTRTIPLLTRLEPRMLPPSPYRRVLVYCPHPREHIYRWDDLVEVARRCPDITFVVLRKGGDPPLDNMEHPPRLDQSEMPDMYASARVLLRLTRTDGSSQCVQEALGFGRHAIWNWWMPGATHVTDVPEAVKAVKALVDFAPYRGGVDSALEMRAQADHAMETAIQEAIG